MGDRDNQVITYLDDREYKQIKEWSDETGKSMSHLLREAILEYTDHDRTARIEEKVDRALTLLEQDGDTHTQTHAGRESQKSVPDKAREIASRIYKNHGAPIKDKDVRRAIEDIAGADDRTVRKYKEQLRSRELLYDHPGTSAVWTDERADWEVWAKNYIDAEPTAHLTDVLDEYGMDELKSEPIESEL